MSTFCPCCMRNNKLAPGDELDGEPKSDISLDTEVNIDDEQNYSDHEFEPDGSWTVTGVFRKVFHASPDNKLAIKLFGSKKGVLLEKKRQDRGCRKWMVHPYSHFRWYWDILIVLLLVFTVIVLPVSIAFYSEDQMQPGWLTVNTLVDILFIADILVNFRTGVVLPDRPDEIILDPKLVGLRYARGWFVVDMVSSFPVDYVVLIFTSGQINNALLKASRALRVIRLVKLISLLKLLRISRLLRFMQRWEELFDLAGGVLRISKLIMLMLLLAHWNGCIQFLIPVLQDVPRGSWISINHLQNATVGEQYTWALFKAISHMLCIGFGRWPPQNMTDAWLTIISMMVGATFYALFIGNMSTLLLSIDSSGRLYSEKLSQVEEYMRYRKLPQDIRLRVQEYYEHRFRKKYFNEEAILQELSKGLKENIISHNCRELVHTVPFFQNASPQFVTAILTKLKFEAFLKGEYIIREGAIGSKMYFVQTGVVAVLNKENKVETRLAGGSHFGEICLLTDDRRVASIRTESICDLFSLSKKHFQAILKEYPEMRCALETIAVRRLSKLGKKPPPEQHHQGRLSTLIPPPHIGKDLNAPPEEEEEAEEMAENKKSGWHSIKRHLTRRKKTNVPNPTTDENKEPVVDRAGPTYQSQLECLPEEEPNMANTNDGQYSQLGTENGEQCGQSPEFHRVDEEQGISHSLLHEEFSDSSSDESSS